MGYYPYSFYSRKSSYDFISFNSKLFSNNADMKQYIIELCEKRNIKIYSHTISVFDFYVTHIIIPGMSEIIKYDDYQFKLEEMLKAISKVGDLRSLSKIKHQIYLEFIDYARKTPELWRCFSDVAKKCTNIDKMLLTTLLRGFSFLENYERTIHYIELLKPHISVDYYSCLLLITDMKKKKHSNKSIVSFLSYYYNTDVIKDVYSFVESQEFNPFYIEKSFDDENNDVWIESIIKFKKGIAVI